MRLLMLEFDQRLAAAVTRSLRQHGVHVTCVQGVEGARQLAAQQSFDAALLDCDALEPDQLAWFARMPLILTTSFLEHAGAHRFFAQGTLLRKPFTSAQLLSTLRDRLGWFGAEPLLLVDVLRKAHTDAESVGFCVGEAELFLEGGELVHVQLKDMQGEAALAEVLAEPSPHLFRIPSRAVDRTIHRPFQTLLLDLLHRLEEREREAWGLSSEPAPARGPRGKGEP